MILCLDIGNSNIFGGLFLDQKLILQFRYPSTSNCTSDQIGIFLKNVIRENGQDPNQIKHVAICSVVPTLDYSIRSGIVKYLDQEPFYLKVGVKTGLKIANKNPNEVGADRIANAVAAVEQFPGKNLIVIDLGTATTFDLISADKAYIGGAIIPGLQIAAKALNQYTAQLPPVNIIKPTQSIGQTTASNIQIGLYYAHLGALRTLTEKFSSEVFKNDTPIIMGTGGFSYLFEDENIFNVTIPDLVLQGLRLTLLKNI